jgi:hypothetical protein
LDGGSASLKAATYIKKARTQNKRTQTYMLRVGLEPKTPVFELAKTVQASDREATLIGAHNTNTVVKSVSRRTVHVEQIRTTHHSEKLNGSEHLEDLRVDEGITLKCVLKIKGMTAWTGFIWFSTETNRWLHERRGITGLFEQPLASQD